MDLFPRLTHGAGNGKDEACLMTAAAMLNGEPEALDNPSCVCPVIRAFVIRTNDAMPEELLGELYGPLAIEIIGTRTDDVEVMRKRAFAFADWVVREIAPLALLAAGLKQEAAQLEILSPVVGKTTARAAAYAAYAAADAADAAAFAAYAAYAAYAAADAAAFAAYAAAYAAYAAADAAAFAAYAAAYAAAFAAADDLPEKIWRKCPEIIRRVAAIGDTRPKEPACKMSYRELCEALDH